jgi:hypothetical protein
MFVALRCCRFTWNGRYPRWNDDHRFRVALGNSIVDSLTPRILGSRLNHAQQRMIAARMTVEL